MLAADPTAAEGLLAGLPVPRRRLNWHVLGALGEPIDGEPVTLDDRWALRLDLALVDAP